MLGKKNEVLCRSGGGRRCWSGDATDRGDGKEMQRDRYADMRPWLDAIGREEFSARSLLQAIGRSACAAGYPCRDAAVLSKSLVCRRVISGQTLSAKYRPHQFASADSALRASLS